MRVVDVLRTLDRHMNEGSHTAVVRDAASFIERALRGLIRTVEGDLEPEDHKRLKKARVRLDRGKPSLGNLVLVIKKSRFMEALAKVEDLSDERALEVLPWDSLTALRNPAAHAERDFSRAEAMLMRSAALLLVDGLGFERVDSALDAGGQTNHNTELVGRAAPKPSVFRKAYTVHSGSLRSPRGPVTRHRAGPNGGFELYWQEFDAYKKGAVCVLAWAAGMDRAFCMSSQIAHHYLHAHAERLGVPCSDEEPVQSSTEAEGIRQEFRVGEGLAAQRLLFLHTSGERKGRVYYVKAGILKKYRELGEHASRLGFPTSNEKSLTIGAESQFEGGTIKWTRLRTTVSYNDPL